MKWVLVGTGKIKVLVKLCVNALGGFWKLRSKMLNCNNETLKKFYKFIYNNYLEYYGCFIGHRTKINGKLCLPHKFHGIFISSDASIGKNCVIYQNVTIGTNATPFSKNIGSPTIGDNCFIGSGATIIGNVKIGHNCRVGANTTVFEDMANNSVAVSNPPNITVRKELLNNRFYARFGSGAIYFENGEWFLERDKETLKELGKAYKGVKF